MPNDIIILPSEAPAPLEIYEQEKIHPDNQLLLDRRLERFRPLERKEKRQLEKRRNQLWKELNRANYNLLITRRNDLWLEATATKECCLLLLTQFMDLNAITWSSWQQRARLQLQLLNAYLELHQRGRRIADQGNHANHELAPLLPEHDEYTDILKRLGEHEEMSEGLRKQIETDKKFYKEAKIVEKIILDTFARTNGCHHVWFDGRGRRQVDIPRFQDSGSSPDSHWFLLAASEYTGFNSWRSILPYGVDVTDLVSERTLENLSVAIGMQVEVRRNENNTQIYFHVNRLDSPDGLPRYFIFRSMFELYPKQDHDLIPFPVGVYENRRVKWLNLRSDPHILIAGRTRAGKSNYLNCIISSWLQTHSPKELQLVLIDNKRGIEFIHYEGVPHLVGNFVQNLEDVLPKLEQVVGLMNERMVMLRSHKKKDIWAYNSSAPEDRIPHLVVVIDEMQTLLNRGQWTRDVHHALATIGSQGAAAGVHLILCTQHPSKETVPMPIKTNMGCFVIFRMSMHTSQTLISSTAAAELPRGVPGRAVVVSGLDMDYAQTPFIADSVVADGVGYAIKTWGAGAPLLVADTDDEDTDQVIPVAPPTFTEEDLIAIAFENFGGDLKARPIFEQIKRQNLISRGDLVKMVKAVIARGEVEYLGNHYRLVYQFGNFYHMEESNPVTHLPAELNGATDEIENGQLARELVEIV